MVGRGFLLFMYDNDVQNNASFLWFLLGDLGGLMLFHIHGLPQLKK